ncbi:hypothetical protein GCM10007857_88810 [Bradyrhizobium iriomotense]|uniref:Uncharacterized protein n=1 Tax=Bradyrhizobium iriomotense TaxID=441950 RepID=A0ABQ6BF54_9BRAD|nr:hypothetical protein GCM10007857_88810 [Bradyrhizobium iriomotense]
MMLRKRHGSIDVDLDHADFRSVNTVQSLGPFAHARHWDAGSALKSALTRSHETGRRPKFNASLLQLSSICMQNSLYTQRSLADLLSVNTSECPEPLSLLEAPPPLDA